MIVKISKSKKEIAKLSKQNGGALSICYVAIKA
jgi:hypothetical protein